MAAAAAAPVVVVPVVGQPALSTPTSFDRVDSVMREETADNDDINISKADVIATPPSHPSAAAAANHPGHAPPATAPAPLSLPGRMMIPGDVLADGVRVLGLHEYKAAAASLAEAFGDDDVAMYFLDTPDRAHWTREQKWALHVKIMEYITYAHLLKGLVVAAGPNYDCVALWMPPGKNMDDTLTIIRSGMWRLNWELSREGKARFFTEFLPLLHDTKAAVLGARDPASWYLVYIGTRPSSRGQGHARRAIEAVTARADAQGQACYLESSKEVNRRIYSRLGFELNKSIYLQRAQQPVVLDIMVREPPVAV